MNKKIMIIAIVVVIAGIAGYWFVSRDSSDTAQAPAPTTSSTLASENTGQSAVSINPNAAPTTTADGVDIAVLLRSVSSITLDTKILENPAYQALEDSTLVLPPITASGRANPFAAAGYGAPAPTTTATVGSTFLNTSTQSTAQTQ